ncbi:hypothetical protein KEF85_10145 [Methylomonas paludis]|uniref:LPS-assembly lipoprotein LptE n=1 Tax=Methylomonas paludis TaxID=1173101 RepID=A0A975MLH0_9GAMM|nr:LPS assembly lipoprotein LptE [Methylomonas paludis]QWF69735.1 hypothetical protein KEF85_10145 [Methylomonas paludis]
MKQAIGGILLFCALLSGCGYHLRGSLDLPESLRNVYMAGASASLQSEMVSMLRASKAKLSDTTMNAGIILKVLKEDMSNRVLSIGTTGKSTESELNYYLRFQFYDNQDKPLMDEQTIEIAREYFNDQTAVLAKSNEDLTIRAEIYKQAARMLMARAGIAIENQKK